MTETLPPLFDELTAIIGLPAVLKLAGAKGGQRISVPGTIKDGHWLSELLGLDVAQKFADYVTNGARIDLDIPFGPSKGFKKLARTQAMIEQGLSSNQIAKSLDMTRRGVNKQKAKLRQMDGITPIDDGENSNQLDMFSRQG